MTWQQWLDAETERLSLKRTSGYRTPGQEAVLGGPASSYHSRGTPSAPGAIDIGGSADRLKQLFDEIRVAFKGRINELYLNLPSGTSEDVKNNRTLGRNPEAGRAQHLHVALEASTGPIGGPTPASRIPAASRGEKALEAAPADVCARSLSWTTPAGWVSAALGREPPEGAVHSICWSDIWVYGAALFIITGGAWLAFKGAGK